MKHRFNRYAFTLVELLVVIGIIAMLIAVVMPALLKSISKGEEAKAKADVQSLAAAWQAYYARYNSWPVTNMTCYGQKAGEKGMNNVSTGIVVAADVLRVLTTNNPLRITFFERSGTEAFSGQEALLDPWGNPYYCLFDLNGDGKVQLSGVTSVYQSVLVWSNGKDGSMETFSDNVTSWP